MLLNTARRSFLAIALLSLLATPFALAQEAATAEMSLDEVIAMNIEAHGGADALASMKTARFTGTMTMGPGMEVPIVMEWKRPDHVRMDMVFQGQTMTQAYDGETAWAFMPIMGKTAPEKLPAEQAKQLIDSADAIEGPLVNWKEKGNQVEYLGVEEVDGTDGHKLKVTLKNGDEHILYLDTDYGLEFKQLTTVENQGQEIKAETEFGDYKEVGDLVFAHSIVSKVVGAPAGQTITIEKIELNVDLPADRFSMPEAEEEASDAKSDG